MNTDVREVGFQTEAAEELRELIATALHNYLRRNTAPQVVSFTAPTGSGKTIMMTALIEKIYSGQENAIFVWLSDSPQLNEQSKQKIEQKSSEIRPGQCITIEDDSFDQRVLDDGHIYFLNTQKLGESSNLTRGGDKRNYTIWETLANTAREMSDHLYIIIDEAHRGARDGKLEEATTIMQRFLKGYDPVGFPPMPVVIGMSATLERFNKLVEGINPNSINYWKVDPDVVKDSHLLKKRILVRYQDEKAIGNDMAILKAAAENWKEKCDLWARYCEEQREDDVNPVFVIQVRDATDESDTATDLESCINKIEESLGCSLEAGEVVHTFSKTPSLMISSLEVPYEEPSRISDNKKIKVVFFKENLSTGWDCPRAETMMSFRRAADTTHIAQLVGRMVRNPLPGHPIANEDLNDVSLYLPYFDEHTVGQVVKALQGQIPQTTTEPAGKKIYDTLTVQAPPIQGRFSREEILKFINEKAGLRSYNTGGVRRTDSPLVSLLGMALLLKQHDLYPTAVKDVTSDIVQMIRKHAEDLKEQGKYEELASQVKQFNLKTKELDAFGKGDKKPESVSLEATDENISDMFDKANNRLDGIGLKYLDGFPRNKRKARMIDVILFDNNENCWKDLENYAKGKLENLEDNFPETRIRQLPTEAFEKYRKIISSGTPQKGVIFHLPETIMVRHGEDCDTCGEHLFADAKTGTATIKYDSSWEGAVIKEEREREDFVCWIRNKGPWALAIPYEYTLGDRRPTYPDFIIVRKDESQGYIVDILEPHDPTRGDYLGKARGFAKYAEKECENKSSCIGRIQMIRQDTFKGKPVLKRLDMMKNKVRKAVLGGKTAEDLKNLEE